MQRASSLACGRPHRKQTAEVECRNADDVDISRHLDCERSSEQREMLRTGVRPDRASDTCMCMLGRRASGLTDSRWSRPVVRELFDRSAVAQHRVDGHGVCARAVRPAPATQQLNAFESRFRSYTGSDTDIRGRKFVPGTRTAAPTRTDEGNSSRCSASNVRVVLPPPVHFYNEGGFPVLPQVTSGR